MKNDLDDVSTNVNTSMENLIKKLDILIDLLTDKRKHRSSHVNKNDSIVFDEQLNVFLNLHKNEAFVDKMKKTFISINVDTELKKMEAWLAGNPNKRYRNYKRFIFSWLSYTSPCNNNEDYVFESIKVNRGAVQ